jgi:putative transcriptional regulator
MHEYILQTLPNSQHYFPYTIATVATCVYSVIARRGNVIINDLGKWRRKRGRGISMAHLARQVRVSRSYICKLERGKVQPSAEVMFRIADYFGCRVEDIFSYSNADKTQRAFLFAQNVAS